MKQQSLIESTTHAAEKYVNVVISPLRDALTYAVPKEGFSELALGCEVEVPLGSRKATGYVVGSTTTSSEGIDYKFISKSSWPYPLFNATQLELFEKVSEYYGATLSQTLESALPPRVPQKFIKYVSLRGAEGEAKGKVEIEIFAKLKSSAEPIPYSHLTKTIKSAPAALKRLLEKGLVQIDQQELKDQFVIKEQAPEWALTEVQLNEHQQAALESISLHMQARRFTTTLLHGVTGSGKTEVYIEAVRLALEQGRGALIIVPEIALTPQLLDRFVARLGSSIAVLHSALQPRARWDGWRALLEKRALIGIGARSAIFAPLHDPGVIIVDEEHDSSYKQGEGLRYNARDLAILRGKLSNCPVVLGSATPSLESFQHAESGRYVYLSLPSRPDIASHTDLEVVDLNRVKPWEMASKHVAPSLKQKIDDALARKEQVFILYNRRGFARYFQCERCENVVECRNCSVTLTYHQTTHKLLCHYCGLEMVPPKFCSNCAHAEDGGSEETKTPAQFVQCGAGTERVFEELQALFPQVAIERLDRDAVSDAQVYRGILSRIRSGETSILVGTQMIAKGHDLPGVTVVGIVDCDIGLHMPDFRASERVFQLLTQAAGRAGRGSKPGSVVLQTRVPRHPAIVHTHAKDYTAYARQELESRKLLKYPPFVRMLRIVASSTDKTLPSQVLTYYRDVIEKWMSARQVPVHVLGPVSAPLERIKALWRAHLLIKSERPTLLNQIMRMLDEVRGVPGAVKVIFDMDPQDML